ncbi:MAG: YaaA family protein, partial [Paracoccaceae bacterium]
DKEIMYADNSIRIISGLYGLLKPSDLIQPYRLEMGTKLNNEKGSDLYDFWRDPILKELDSILSSHKEKTIINLASKEYFNVVDVNNINAKILDTDFLEEKDGVTKIISFFAKKARGAMANYIVKNKINNCQDLKGFNLHGYKFRPDLSSELKYVYSRSSAK